MTVAPERRQRIQIENIPQGTTEPTIRALLLRHGPVTGYERPTDPATRRPGTRAYVQMAPLDATSAIAALQGHHLVDQPLQLSAVPDVTVAPDADASAGG